MIWCVEYNEKNGIEEKDVVNIYDVDEEGFDSTDDEIGEVYKGNNRICVYIKAGTKAEALKSAKRYFENYCDSLKGAVEDLFSAKIKEASEFKVGNVVRVIKPGEVFTEYYSAFGDLLDKAYSNGYRGSFVVGGKPDYDYNLAKTVFRVIAKGQYEANDKKDVTLYMIAELVEANAHYYKYLGEDGGLLRAYVYTQEGLERK